MGVIMLPRSPSEIFNFQQILSYSKNLQVGNFLKPQRYMTEVVFLSE